MVNHSRLTVEAVMRELRGRWESMVVWIEGLAKARVADADGALWPGWRERAARETVGTDIRVSE